jgi:hypothetical protein
VIFYKDNLLQPTPNPHRSDQLSSDITNTPQWLNTSWEVPSCPLETQSLTISTTPTNQSPVIMNSPFHAQPCDSPKSLTLETTFPHQIDMTSTQKANPNLIKKVPSKLLKSPNMVPSNAKHLTHIDYSQSHNSKSSFIPLQ